jgi:hypothetical protein
MAFRIQNELQPIAARRGEPPEFQETRGPGRIGAFQAGGKLPQRYQNERVTSVLPPGCDRIARTGAVWYPPTPAVQASYHTYSRAGNKRLLPGFRRSFPVRVLAGSGGRGKVVVGIGIGVGVRVGEGIGIRERSKGRGRDLEDWKFSVLFGAHRSPRKTVCESGLLGSFGFFH